jgi:hypothetical protein
MMKMMLVAVTAAALSGGGVYAVQRANDAKLFEASYNDQVAVPAQRIIIGLDISKSNPLVDDPAFAAKVGQRVGDLVRKLGFASEVHVRTFGSFEASSNPFYYDTMISTRARPEAVAAEVQRLISGTPLLVARGKWVSQENTNIIAFMDNVANSIGCAKLPTTVILASDGIEDSEYVRLQEDGSHLPSPDGKPFSGCKELTILGIGQGTRSPIETVHLRREWARWSAAAGFGHFTGLNDW